MKVDVVDGLREEGVAFGPLPLACQGVIHGADDRRASYGILANLNNRR